MYVFVETSFLYISSYSKILDRKRIQKPVHTLFDPSKISNEEYQKSIVSFKNVLDRWNISNDRYYDQKANKTGRVRHTFGQSTVHHSQPALKLLPAFVSMNITFQNRSLTLLCAVQMPFYKVRLEKLSQAVD